MLRIEASSPMLIGLRQEAGVQHCVRYIHWVPPCEHKYRLGQVHIEARGFDCLFFIHQPTTYASSSISEVQIFWFIKLCCYEPRSMKAAILSVLAAAMAVFAKPVPHREIGSKFPFHQQTLAYLDKSSRATMTMSLFILMIWSFILSQTRTL